MSTIKTTAQSCFDEIVELRREIHRHPELGRTEIKTSELIRNKLNEYGVDHMEIPCPTATVALIHGSAGEGRCVALRADIDALPVTEETGLPYSSETPGVMHACGHDMNTSMLLGVAKVLCSMRETFRGTVKLIFQHSEDTLPGGAKELVEHGVMENPHVDAIFAIHMFPDESRVGQIGLHAGPLTTSVDLYEVTVHGKGGHGSAPHTTHDPILAACQMITLLQQIPSRYIDPLETVIFPICMIQGGEAVNIIPSQAKFSGVARSYVDSVREKVNQQVYDIATGMEAVSGCKIEINHYEGYPACYNTPELVDIAREAICSELGDDAVVELDKPLAFSEDFSYYTKMTGTPGAYLMLYGGHLGSLVSLHNPKCALQEEAMPSGVTALASTAVAFLNR